MFISNVFIDTSVFISANYDINSKIFTDLKSYCKDGRIQLFICDITISEIDSNITKNTIEAGSIIKKFCNKARILRNLSSEKFKGIFDEFQHDEISKEVQSQIELFLSECNATIINASSIDASKVFEDYFKGKAPFGEGKKKCEFPDAFVVKALKKWCKENNQKICIVSEDPDFEKACKDQDIFVYLSSLAKYIDIILADKDKLIELIHDKINIDKEKIYKAIIPEIKDYNMVVMDADPEAEAIVEGVEIQKISDVSVIGISENSAIIEASILARLDIYVNCYDPDSWYKDWEDKSIHYWDKIETNFEREEQIHVEFEISFDRDSFDEFEIDRVIVNKGNQLTFYLVEDDDFY